jgi:two-component system, chemotaxis family, protein-glutamate methylesterase/glutaminase
MSKIRVLVVDDSVVIRKVVSEELTLAPDIEVAGIAANGLIALNKIQLVNPDLVLLDVEMPEMDGLATLAAIRKKWPTLPVIMFSALTEEGASATIEALALGASDYFAKPGGPNGLEASRRVISEKLIPAIHAICKPKAALAPPPQNAPPDRLPTPPVVQQTIAGKSRLQVVVIGISTGGPNALTELFQVLPAGLPVPILIVQHMPPLFTRFLAERLAATSKVPISEAESGQILLRGCAIIAPGDYHLEVTSDGGTVRTRLTQEPPENSCRPAVDPLFRSVAKIYGAGVLAVVMTGMGSDGLLGAHAVRAAGGQILIQDEASSVVWGMPGFVARAGLADKVLPLSELAMEIVRRVKG